MNNKCPGCGAPLTSGQPLCQRCFQIKHYSKYEPTTKTNADYQKIITTIPHDALVIYVSSLLNNHIEDLTHFSHTILVLTKKDLLPKSVQDYKLINYFHHHYPHFKDIIVVSSTTNYHLDSLYQKVLEYASKPIYIIGYTNSGKSTLLNKLIQNYSEEEANITTSIYPSTTLDTITVKLNNLTITDTPGLINPHSLINHIDSTMLGKITPKKTIKPRTYQLKGQGSLMIEDFLRLDYDTRSTSMTIYIANAVNIPRISPSNPKLHDCPHQTIHIDDHQDLIIPDLCFIKFTNRTKLNIYTKYPLQFPTRDNLI